MEPKRYIIKKGKARISFSDVGKCARVNDFDFYRLLNLVLGCCETYKGWSLEYAK